MMGNSALGFWVGDDSMNQNRVLWDFPHPKIIIIIYPVLEVKKTSLIALEVALLSPILGQGGFF